MKNKKKTKMHQMILKEKIYIKKKQMVLNKQDLSRNLII